MWSEAWSWQMLLSHDSASVWGESYPSLLFTERRLLAHSSHPFDCALHLSWYPFHLHRLQPAGVEWGSRCWGDKSSSTHSSSATKISESIWFLSSHAGKQGSDLFLPSPFAIQPSEEIIIQCNIRVSKWLFRYYRMIAVRLYQSAADRQTEQKHYRRL